MPLVVVALSIVCVAALGVSAAAAASGSIQGAAFQDLNRNGVRDPGESPFANEQLYLYDGDFQYLGTTYTDAAGHYEFTGLTDGVYHVHFASPSWWSLRHDWVPTTTGTLLPKLTVNLAITATADFGWRPIVRSSDIAAPFSSYTGPTGLRTYSYDDVVTAKEVYDAVMRGAVGAEAQYVTVRFDYGATSTTSTSWQGTPGSFSSFSAVC
jgi:hypothetical protein